MPVRNEETVLPELLRRTRAVLDGIARRPPPASVCGRRKLRPHSGTSGGSGPADPRLMVVSLSRNFGHQAALTAALDYVSGDAVVLMDGDLQDVPEAIPAFVKRYEEGYDVVYATRAARKEGWYLRLCYYLFYRLQTLLSETRLPLDAGDFGLISRRVVEQLRRMPEHHRYLRGLRSWVGFRQIGIPVERAERHSGRSKYGMLKLLKLASDGIFAFSIVPLRAAALLGTLAISLSGAFRVLLAHCQDLSQPVAQGLHGAGFPDYLSLRCSSALPGDHRRIRWAHLRRDQGAPLYVVNRAPPKWRPSLCWSLAPRSPRRPAASCAGQGTLE